MKSVNKCNATGYICNIEFLRSCSAGRENKILGP